MISRHPHKPSAFSDVAGEKRRLWRAFPRTESTEGLHRGRSIARGHGGGRGVSHPRTTKSGGPKRACQTGSGAGLKRFSTRFCPTTPRLADNFFPATQHDDLGFDNLFVLNAARRSGTQPKAARTPEPMPRSGPELGGPAAWCVEGNRPTGQETFCRQTAIIQEDLNHGSVRQAR